jgi:Zn-dependent peptidase ImmA (M78 family)
LRYGFKAQAERMAVAAREALGLEAMAPLNPAQYAAYIGVHILTLEELGLSDYARRQLLEVDPRSWSGMAIRESGLTGVFVNPTHTPERRASTMMHELAHIELKHVPIRVDISAVGILLVSEYSEDDEEEANWLSGSFLLPREALRHYRNSGWSQARIKAHFGVSDDMYTWRIRMTGVEVQMRRAKAST